LKQLPNLQQSTITNTTHNYIADHGDTARKTQQEVVFKSSAQFEIRPESK